MKKSLMLASLLVLLSAVTVSAQATISGGQSVVLASVAAPYTVGDIIAADTTTTFALVNDVATGNVLLSGGVGTIPLFGKVTLTGHVSGILPVVNGGTANAFFTVAGPAATAKTYTFPNANATILTTNALVTSAQIVGGTAPASSTGFGSGVAGVVQAGSGDYGGRITVGIGGDTTGALTYGGTYTVAPHCVANNETTGAALKVSSSTSVLTFTGTMVAADTVTWVCR